ncbi:elongation factor 1-beta [Biomphalaria pfeifferi]|uniref:Elongation factor 1-beta n=1 Tax=Biomphalaria pfeifferi TaxID=112525 RepID=A0AAD8BPA0_BIOPF|nr:elongation factor 1-beta [Biomphalaria glabrata]KAK0058304.1 elongation factor 1-beta [Biomphalaria pfeifferi]
MGFGDLKSQSGLQTLNEFLGDRSYIEGFVPSQADIAVYEAVGKAPAANLSHALRWYNHITSYQSQKDSLPGVKKSLDSYGPAGTAAPAKPAPVADDDDDDDEDLFGSDDEETKALKAKRLADYEAKKAKKPALIAKSNIILDVKPWDDTTDMDAIEKHVRSIEADGLLWGASKFVPVGYGIRKLQISCVVEDDKVSVDFLEEEITKNEDLVQSVDIAAFNKV